MLPPNLQKFPKIAGLLQNNPDQVDSFANQSDGALMNFEKLLTNDPKLYEMMLKSKLPRIFSDAPDRPSSGSSLGAG